MLINSYHIKFKYILVENLPINAIGYSNTLKYNRNILKQIEKH